MISRTLCNNQYEGLNRIEILKQSKIKLSFLVASKRKTNIHKFKGLINISLKENFYVLILNKHIIPQHSILKMYIGIRAMHFFDSRIIVQNINSWY